MINAAILMMLMMTGTCCAVHPVAMAKHPDCEPHQGNWSKSLSLVGDSERAPAEMPITVAVHFQPRNEAELDQRIADMHTPGHPLYGLFLTPAVYQAAHGPTKGDVVNMLNHLRSYGLQVVEKSGHTIKARGQVGHIEKAFDTTIAHFSRPDGLLAFGPTRDISLPSHLPRVVVDGLSQKKGKRTHKRLLPAMEVPRARQEPLTAKVIRSAYQIPDNATGKGQTIAMLELDGYVSRDLDTYAQSMGIRRVPTRNILVGGYKGGVTDEDARVEVTMDIELAMAMAPGLDEIVVYEAANDDTGLNDLLGRLANPRRGEKLIRVASLSWGEPESELSAAEVTAEYNLLRQLAAQGQTVFVASGDSGARDDGHRIGTDDPASQPYAFAVGGTTLRVMGGKWRAEKAWADGGGGISCFWSAPAWQAGIDAPNGKGSLTLRDVPDVSLNADPNTGYEVFVGDWMSVGGTSCAAPLWAAFAGLVNENRVSRNKDALGFWGPLFYQAAKTPAGKLGLHDIADNSTNGYYPAVKGIDDATGWGTIIGGPLIEALSAQ